MNNAFEFTFMPESYPSQRLLSLPSPLPSFLFYPHPTPPPPPFHPPLLLFLSSLFILIRAQPHFSSLLSAPPPLAPPPSDSRQETVRDQTGASRAEHLLYQCLLSGSCSGGCSLMYLHIHEFRIGPLARSLPLPPQKLSIHFAGLSEKDTVEVSIKS